MTRYLTLQSSFFMLSVMLSVLLTFYAQGSVSSVAMLPLVLFITIFGVPHGALDTLFAAKAFGLNNTKRWLIFLSGYLSLSAIVLICWFLLPTIFFILFLAFSAKHFADDLIEHQNPLLSALYGLNIITLPSIFYAQDLLLLYGYLINSDYLFHIVNVIKLLAIISLLLTSWLTFKFCYRNSKGAAKRAILELLTVSVLMLLVKPLLAFTIYFCLMHSARHIIRAKFYFMEYSNTVLLFNLVMPTFATFVVCVIIFATLPVEKVDENLIKVTFAALAALTFPHGFLLSKVGFINWLKSNPV